MPRSEGEIAVTEAAQDDVFIDDIALPAADGYLLGASLFLPRGAKRHAVLINSATAVPRKVYRGFAGYLARRGCAVLTYDYRGIGDSQAEIAGRLQPVQVAQRLQGLDGGLGRARHDRGGGLDARALQGDAARLCRAFLRRPGAGIARQQYRGVARAADRGAGRLLETDGDAGALPRLRYDECGRRCR